MLKIEGFEIENQTVKNKTFSLKGILIFPLVLIASPFLIVGFAFFSAIDWLAQVLGKTKINEPFSFTVAIEGMELTFIEAVLNEEQTSKIDPEIEVFQVTTSPIEYDLSDFYVFEYFSNKVQAFLLGFENDNLKLVILSKTQFKKIELVGGWAIENDEHNDSEFCQLRHYHKKHSTIYTLKPFAD